MRRRNTPSRPLLAALLAAALAVPAVALAGHPDPGATYSGTSEKRDHVLIKVNNSGHHLYLEVTDPCDTTLKGGGLTIGGRGRFDAVSRRTGAEVKGTFVSRRKVVGTIDNRCKHLGTRDFVARRQ